MIGPMLSNRKSRSLSCRITAVFVFVSVITLNAQNAGWCEGHPYGGFDGRLTVTILGRVPMENSAFVGFEVIHNQPVVAFPHRVLAMTPKSILSWASVDNVRNIAADAENRLLVQTDKTILTPGSGNVFVSVDSLAKAVHGELLDSGNSNVLSLSKSGPETWTLTAERSNGTEGSSLQLHDAVKAVSWNENGLSLIAGGTLVTWPVGTVKMSVLGSDTGFAEAQDSCLAAPDRAVVALRNIVVLITRDTAAVVVSMAARVRCSGDSVHLLDTRTGVIARVTGLERIGHKLADREYARSLISLAAGPTEKNPTFLEAARILGCTGARALAEKRLTRPVSH